MTRPVYHRGSPSGRLPVRWCLLLALSNLSIMALWVSTAASQPDSTTLDPPVASSDSNYWGPSAAPRDSSLVVFTQPGLPAWEAAFVYPWRVITYPVKLVGDGIGALVVAGQESRLLKGVTGLFSQPDQDHGITPDFTIGGLNGTGGGLTYFDNSFPGPNHRARIGADFTSNGSKRYRLGFLFNQPGPASLELGVGYRLRRSARFFGLGPDSRVEDESFFGLETSWGGVGLDRRLGDNWSLYVSAVATRAGTTRPPGNPNRSIDSVFVGDLPYGYGERSDGGSIGFDLMAGQPRTHVRPDDEALLRLHLGFFDDWNGGSAPYWSGSVTARRYFPILHPQRTLGLRGVMAWSDPVAGGDIPFQRLNSNSDLERFRGYQDFRFTDRGLLLMTAEYRWPIWVAREANRAGIDMILLTDYGQVFREIDQINTHRLAASYGIAFELAGLKGMLARLEFGRSDEETVVRFGLVSLVETGAGQIFLGRTLDRGP